MTEWKAIPGTNGTYEVSRNGSVRKVSEGGSKAMVPHADQKGYLRVRLTVNGKRGTAKVHRLVAQAFIPNPEEKPEVNHKDGDKRNNAVENLEWVTAHENTIHAYQTGLKEKTRARCKVMGDTVGRDILRAFSEARQTPVEATRLLDGKVFVFQSQHEAATKTGASQPNIHKVLRGTRKSANGYAFRYAEVMPE